MGHMGPKQRGGDHLQLREPFSTPLRKSHQFIASDFLFPLSSGGKPGLPLMPGHGEAPPWVVQQLVGTHSPSTGVATAQAALQLLQKECISNKCTHPHSCSSFRKSFLLQAQGKNRARQSNKTSLNNLSLMEHPRLLPKTIICIYT